MNAIRPVIALFLAALFAAPAATAAAPVVQESEFLVYLIEGNATSVVKTDIVPLIPNQVCFGWRLRLAGTGSVVKAVEELTLPEPPASWIGIDGDEYSPTRISPDRRTATTTSFYTLQDGWIEHSWCIAEGDPAGPHTIRILAEGEVLKRFDFTVSEPYKLTRRWPEANTR